MGILQKLVLAVLFFSFVVFVALFGQIPAFRNTPISFLNRLIRVQLPKTLRYGDSLLTGGRVGRYSRRLGNYLVGSNPIVMIAFLALLTASAAFFLRSAWSRLGHGHHLLIAILLPLPYLSTYKCAASTASYITKANHHAEMRIYPYDHTIFYPGHLCRTCSHLKPARSKHCATCGVCVARQDHHCVWVNNCVGRHNHRWFLALLTSLGALLAYGGALAAGLLAPLRPRQREPGAFAYMDAWGVAIGRDVWVGAVGLLAGLTAPLAWGLLAYHVYLIWAGMTTNETAKWGDLRDEVAAGTAFKGTREMVPESQLKRAREAAGEDIEPPTSWPAKSEQVVLTTRDGEPPSFAGSDARLEAARGGDNGWVRCWRLADVDNIYDLGFRGNLLEAVLPRGL